jgi:hypothetical protein
MNKRVVMERGFYSGDLPHLGCSSVEDRLESSREVSESQEADIIRVILLLQTLPWFPLFVRKSQNYLVLTWWPLRTACSLCLLQTKASFSLSFATMV